VSNGIPPPRAISSFAPGSLIAAYQLEEQIGRGGMAVVFRAHDQRLNRQVALKIMAPVTATDEAFRQRFIRESQAAAAVDDPNIIPVYEAGESDGVLFIAMRLVRGGDLKTVAGQHGPLPPARAEWILSAVASALDAAHAAGLVHRDVKPANILLDVRPGRPDHVYLSDFGVSKASLGSAGLTSSGQFLGTVEYAAPEQIQDRPVDGRADQYALGCSAFELLCGQPPFFGKHWMAAMYAHLSEPPPVPTSLRTGLPPAVDSVFAKVLAKSPEDRYPTCQDFASALRSALGLRLYAVPDPADPGQRGGIDVAGHDDMTLDPAAAGLAAVKIGAGAPGGDPGAGNGAVNAASAASGRTDPVATVNVTLGGRPGQLSTGQRGLSSAPRNAAFGVLAAVVLAAGVAAGGLLTRSAAQATPYLFRKQAYPDGLAITQRWRLGGRGGSSLDVSITASNATSAPVTVQLEEPVPAAVASSLRAVHFVPAARLLAASRMVVWDLRLPARGEVVVGYQAHELPAGATESRLKLLVAAFTTVEARQLIEPITPGSVLQALTITPDDLDLAVGQTGRLRLRGRLRSGASAPAADLSGAVWTIANRAVASVNSRGQVVGESAGVTRVTAQVGAARASAVVTVTGPGAAPPASGYSYSPPAAGPSTTPSPTATPSPTPTSTPSPTPTTPSPTPTQGTSSGVRRALATAPDPPGRVMD
jgi:hypothetical protein